MVSPVLADDWTQWRGLDRLGIWNETGIVEELPPELKITWRAPIRGGFSGPVVSNGRVFVTDWQEDSESRTMDGVERVVVGSHEGVLDEQFKIEIQEGSRKWTETWR